MSRYVIYGEVFNLVLRKGQLNPVSVNNRGGAILGDTKDNILIITHANLAKRLGRNFRGCRIDSITYTNCNNETYQHKFENETFFSMIRYKQGIFEIKGNKLKITSEFMKG